MEPLLALPPPQVLALLPAEAAWRFRAVPLDVHGDALALGALPGLPSAATREIEFVTGKHVTVVDTDAAALEALLAAAYPGGEPPPRAERPRPSPGAQLPLQHERRSELPDLSGGSAVQIVSELIEGAIGRGASDIHVEPYERAIRVRYRLDGVLSPVGEVAVRHRDAVVSRLKILAGLDIAERRRPQDGRIRFTREGGRGAVDLRVSTLPTGYGEKVVLRVLDRSGLRLDLDALGFDERELGLFRRGIRASHGVVLVTGPTGSGKTTTLYAALDALNTPELNVLTVEDPVEYDLPGVNQTSVRPDIGLTFAHALRAFLRQDPDVVMVGEVRDTETAEIAVRAALTGHLVLSTIHTNDAPSTVTRLLDMGVEPFLVASSLRLVVAQRLIRRVCPDCRTEAATDEVVRRELGAEGDALRTHAVGAGCERCNGTGYRGRMAIYEVMPMSEPLAALVIRGAGVHELRNQARAEGLRTLREAALDCVARGLTTPAEALRATAL